MVSHHEWKMLLLLYGQQHNVFIFSSKHINISKRFPPLTHLAVPNTCSDLLYFETYLHNDLGCMIEVLLLGDLYCELTVA